MYAQKCFTYFNCITAGKLKQIPRASRNNCEWKQETEILHIIMKGPMYIDIKMAEKQYYYRGGINIGAPLVIHHFLLLKNLIIVHASVITVLMDDGLHTLSQLSRGAYLLLMK